MPGVLPEVQTPVVRLKAISVVIAWLVLVYSVLMVVELPEGWVL
jgi:hypothetical protein